VLIAQRPTLTEEVISEHRSRFSIEPLEPGFGYTLGNSMRRTLLSSIPGAAVTSIRIDGVLHEFSTVPGVKEDVTELILNIKALVVSSENDEPVVMYLRKQGAGQVTAADIVPPAGVEVHNPDLHLATLNEKGKLEIELTVERGRGYVSAAQNKAFDGLARELNVEAEGIEIGPSPTDAALAADLALPIEDLQLTIRSYNCLKREGIHTVGELVARSEADLLDIRNFGAKSITEVKEKLAELGLVLKDSPLDFDASAETGYYSDDDTDFSVDEQY